MELTGCADLAKHGLRYRLSKYGKRLQAVVQNRVARRLPLCNFSPSGGLRLHHLRKET
jgi:hypothetical protein